MKWLKNKNLLLIMWGIYIVFAVPIYFMDDDSSLETIKFMTILWGSITVIIVGINWAKR